MNSKELLSRQNCPECGVSWIGNPIPDDLKKEYNNRSHFTKLVAVPAKNNFSKIVAYECPGCEFNFRVEGKQ